MSNLSLFEHILNDPLFQVPAEVGDPGEDLRSWPNHSTGQPNETDKTPDELDRNLPMTETYNSVKAELARSVVYDMLGGPVNAYYSLLPFVYANSLDTQPGWIQLAVGYVKNWIEKSDRSDFLLVECDDKNLYAKHLPVGEVEDHNVLLAYDKISAIRPYSPDVTQAELEDAARSILVSLLEQESFEMLIAAKPDKKGKDDDKDSKPSGPVDKTVPAGPDVEASACGHECSVHTASNAPATHSMPSLPPDPNNMDTINKDDPKHPFQPQKDPLGGPKDPNNMNTISEDDPANKFKPGASPLGTKPTENDAYSFPAKAPAPSWSPQGAGRDLGAMIPLGPQGEEYNRHNPGTRQEEKAGLLPPWEVATAYPQAGMGMCGDDYQPTPGMEYMGNCAKDDGHIADVESSATLADLYAKRYAKSGLYSELKKQASSFAVERACMATLKECAKHDATGRAYAKEMFAYSYGQMRRSLNRAIRQFTEKEEVDEAAFKELKSFQADLISEASRSYFADAKLSVELAAFVAKKDDDGDDDKGDDDDMKEADLKEATEIAVRLLGVGMIESSALSETIVDLVKSGAEGRKTWVSMANKLGAGAPIVVNKAAEVAPGPGAGPVPATRASLSVAESNLVPNGTQDNAFNGRDPRKQKASLNAMNAFSAGKQSALSLKYNG